MAGKREYIYFPQDVRLSSIEMMEAVILGAGRRINSIKAGRKGGHQFSESVYAAWGEDIEGAAAEMVVARTLGFYFTPTINTFKAPDVGAEIQVRSSYRKDGSLIIRPHDPDHHYYFLVVGSWPFHQIVGYTLGNVAKEARWERAPGGRPPAYFVPQHQLCRCWPAREGWEDDAEENP
ncbi:MAG: hypothetical protein JSU72_20835 [Deltaproteobacteria bacterium]|nr:MAG: hypothetical protein JSU72_20835 [Deltaproteobacteria bacterium]